jgi:hypothetical protein
MRDKRFVAEHRGGPLKKEQHRQLIKWSYGCVEHLLPLFAEKLDDRLYAAVATAKAWEQGRATVGEARKAALEAIVLANESTTPAAVALARAAGHAVATAHMSDHALGAALYGLKVVKNTGGSVEAEMKWQNDLLSPEIRELVLTAMREKLKHFKI